MTRVRFAALTLVLATIAGCGSARTVPAPAPTLGSRPSAAHTGNGSSHSGGAQPGGSTHHSTTSTGVHGSGSSPSGSGGTSSSTHGSTATKPQPKPQPVLTFVLPGQKLHTVRPPKYVGPHKIPAPPPPPPPGGHAAGRTAPSLPSVPQGNRGQTASSRAGVAIIWLAPRNPQPGGLISVYGKLFYAGRYVQGARMKIALGVRNHVLVRMGTATTGPPSEEAIVTVTVPRTVKNNTKIFVRATLTYRGTRFYTHTTTFVER